MNGVTETIVVYCEGREADKETGTKESPDKTLLLQLLLGCRVTIKPIGGKVGWGKFFDAFAPNNERYVAIRDRDFDKPPLFDNQQKAGLQEEKDNSNIYLMGLTCVESYVLDAKLLHTFFAMNYPNKTFPTEEELAENLNTLVYDLVPVYAATWALRALKVNVRHRNLGDPKFKEPFTKENCIQEAHTAIETFRTEYAQKTHETLESVTTDAFDGHFATYESLFGKDDVIQQKHYRAWFDGKTLLNRWYSELSLGNPNRYLTWALKNMDFSQHADLLAFRDICCSLSS